LRKYRYDDLEKEFCRYCGEGNGGTLMIGTVTVTKTVNAKPSDPKDATPLDVTFTLCIEDQKFLLTGDCLYWDNQKDDEPKDWGEYD